MRTLLVLVVLFMLSSCWRKERTHYSPSVYTFKNVWGNKAVYADINAAKQVVYSDSVFPVLHAGNICAVGNRIYQVEMGRGIHIIDNSVPSQAHRIGFILVNGVSQISIKNNNLFTNCYDDLLVIDISGADTIQLVKRLAGAFPNGLSQYYYVQPEDA